MYYGKGNGNPIQYSSLENPVDRGACWAAVYGVTQSQTQLKHLSSSSRSMFPQHIGNPCWLSCKESAYIAGVMGSIPGSGRSGEGNGTPPQYSCLENSMDREAWQDMVHGVMKGSDTPEQHPACTVGVSICKACHGIGHNVWVSSGIITCEKL